MFAVFENLKKILNELFWLSCSLKLMSFGSHKIRDEKKREIS